MDVVLRPSMTLEESLAWEEGQDLRHAFDGFQPVARTGGTRSHAAIQRNLILSLGNRLRGEPCQVFGSELKLEVAGSIRYPDAFVVCTPGANSSKLVRDPVVVFEVASSSTAYVDRVVKAREYSGTPSIQHYVILEQTGIGATVFAREGGDWVARVLEGGDAVLALPEIGMEVPLGEFYLGLIFDPPLPDYPPSPDRDAAPDPEEA